MFVVWLPGAERDKSMAKIDGACRTASCCCHWLSCSSKPLAWAASLIEQNSNAIHALCGIYWNRTTHRTSIFMAQCLSSNQITPTGWDFIDVVGVCNVCFSNLIVRKAKLMRKNACKNENQPVNASEMAHLCTDREFVWWCYEAAWPTTMVMYALKQQLCWWILLIECAIAIWRQPIYHRKSIMQPLILDKASEDLVPLFLALFSYSIVFHSQCFRVIWNAVDGIQITWALISCLRILFCNICCDIQTSGILLHSTGGSRDAYLSISFDAKAILEVSLDTSSFHLRSMCQGKTHRACHQDYRWTCSYLGDGGQLSGS